LTIFLYTLGIMAAITFLWIMLKTAQYTTPLAALAGLILGGVGLSFGSFHLFAFGGGLLLFSLFIRAINAVMNGGL
jgi:hypothetical protein